MRWKKALGKKPITSQNVSRTPFRGGRVEGLMFRAKCIFCSLRIIVPREKSYHLRSWGLGFASPACGGPRWRSSRPRPRWRSFRRKSWSPTWFGCKISGKEINMGHKGSWAYTPGHSRYQGWGLHSTEVAFLLLTQQPWVWFSAFQKIYFDVAEIYQLPWLEESGLVLASGKQVLQKDTVALLLDLLCSSDPD